jgi:Icc-related predicted phosphoesterase
VTCLGYPGNDNYQSMKLPNGTSVLGLPYVVDLPRWAFNINEKRLREHLKIMGSHDIIVSHAPIKGIMDLGFGLKAYRDYLDHSLYSVKYWIFGHIHEEYGQIKYNDTHIYNVAMCNRAYIHQNPPVVIEI